MSTQSVAPDMAHVETVPNRRPLWYVSLLLVAVGLFVSGYLSYVKIFATDVVCAGGEVFNCSAVLASVYSWIGPFPIALLGFTVYVLLGVMLLTERTGSLMTENSHLMLFGLSLFAWIYSMYLVYLQAFVLLKYCPWCLTHEANMTLLFGVLTYRMMRRMGELNAA